MGKVIYLHEYHNKYKGFPHHMKNPSDQKIDLSSFNIADAFFVMYNRTSLH